MGAARTERVASDGVAVAPRQGCIDFAPCRLISNQDSARAAPVGRFVVVTVLVSPAHIVELAQGHAGELFLAGRDGANDGDFKARAGAHGANFDAFAVGQELKVDIAGRAHGAGAFLLER